jgi:nucleotide-binding universal stress UspA family protein
MIRILVPIDFSEQAACAVRTAANIARKSGAEIFLLHMLDLPANDTDLSAHGDASSPAKAFYLQQIHEKIKKIIESELLEGVKVSEEVRFHKTFSGIINYSKELETDLIVMGSHGATGLKEMFIGSNTEKVVRNSDIPVLVVKSGYGDFEMNKFVFASNFKEDIKPSFERLLKFISKFDAELHLLFVNTIHNFETTKETNERMKKFVKEFDMPKYSMTIYNDRSIEKGIINFSNEIGVDIIALNTHQRKGLSSMFNDSISQDLVNHALKPVVTFKI